MIYTSTVLPVLLLLPLYPLLKAKYFPPDPIAIYRTQQQASHQFRDVINLVDNEIDDITTTSPPPTLATGSRALPDRSGVNGADLGTGFGVTVDMGRIRSDLGINGMMDGLLPDLEGSEGIEGGIQQMVEAESGKKAEKKKLSVLRKELEDQYGASLVFVLGDIAVSTVLCVSRKY
jgi:hypothetical protein